MNDRDMKQPDGAPRYGAVARLLHWVIVLVGLVAGHVAMVLRHQLIDRNPEMSRMWPPWGR